MTFLFSEEFTDGIEIQIELSILCNMGPSKAALTRCFLGIDSNVSIYLREVSDVFCFFNSKRVPEGEERCRKKAQSTEAPGPELRREQVSI